MKKLLQKGLLVMAGLMTGPAMAHDPIFGVGPHVLFKNGFETSVELEAEKAGAEKEQALALEVTYGLTGDWALGVDLPYEFKQDGTTSSSGNGDVAAFTKYRFWRRDSLGLQESAAVLLKVVTDTAQGGRTPALD